MDLSFGKLSTLLIASVLFRVSQALSYGKHQLPSLIREKRLDLLDDEPASNEPVDVKAFSSGNTEDTEGMTKSLENIEVRQKNPDVTTEEIMLHRKNNSEVNEQIVIKAPGEKLQSNESIVKPEPTEQPKKDQQRKPGKNGKIILPGIRFGFKSQETSKLPKPNKEIQHQFKLRLKRKIRRRLRQSKKLEGHDHIITLHTNHDVIPTTLSAKQFLLQSQMNRDDHKKISTLSSLRSARLPKYLSKLLQPSLSVRKIHQQLTAKTSEQAKHKRTTNVSNVRRKHSKKRQMFYLQKVKELPKSKSSIPGIKNERMENSNSFSKILKGNFMTTPTSSIFEDSSTPISYNTIKGKEQMNHPKKPLTRQKRLSTRKDDLMDSSLKLSSTLRFTFSSPFQGLRESKPSTSNPATARAEGSPTVRPLATPNLSPVPSSSPEFPPSLKQIPSEDLMMLNDFFNHATAFQKKLKKKAKTYLTQRRTPNISSGQSETKQLEEHFLKFKDYNGDLLKSQNPGKNENGDNDSNVKDEKRHKNGGNQEKKHDKNETDSNAYAKELLEFQRKAIEAEEKRLDDEIRGKPHENSFRWRKHIHHLEQENRHDQHEVQEVFEKMAEKWKHRRNQAIQGIQSSQLSKGRHADERLNENKIFERANSSMTHYNKLSTPEIASSQRFNNVKDSHEVNFNLNKSFEGLSAKWKNRQILEEEEHKSRWSSQNSSEGYVNEKGINRNRRKMLSVKKSSRTPTTSLHQNENDEDIVEMAFTPTLRRFSPTAARIHSSEDGKSAEVSMNENGEALINGVVPTESTINSNKNTSYQNQNSTFYTLSENKATMENDDKHDNGQEKSGKNSNIMIYKNDDDDANDEDEIVFDQVDDASPRYSRKNGTTVLGGNTMRKKLNDTYNLTAQKHNSSDDDYNDNDDDDDSDLFNNSNNNDYANNNKITGHYLNTFNKIKSTDMNDTFNENKNNRVNSDNSNYKNKNDHKEKNQTSSDSEDVPHDDRLLYILGDPIQVDKKQKRRKNLEDLVDKVKLNGNKEEDPEVVLDKELKTKLKAMEIKVLDAHQKVSKDLEDIERHLTKRYKSLKHSINQAKSLTEGMDNKINDTVLQILKLAKTSADKAKSKIKLVQKATMALNDIEKRLGANETRNVARVIKSNIAQLPINKYQSYQRILAVNNLIAKMDGAKLLAESKANKSFSTRNEIEKNMADIATNVLEELTSAENELNSNTKVEMDDEREAEEKLEDAERRNFKVALKSGEALEKIEGYLAELEKEEKKLRNTSQ